MSHNAPVLPRFYAPALGADDETVALEDDEASHLVRVLRIPPGREVRVFNGRGVERLARVELADKRGVVLRIVAPATSARELPFPLVLVQAVLKGDAMDDVVRDAVMLGVSGIDPVVSSHTEVSLAHVRRAQRTDRWRRIAVASAKQCGRAVVPAIGEPGTLGDAIVRAADGRIVMLVEPSAGAPRSPRELEQSQPAVKVAVLAGPEGGWSPDEVDEARAAHATLLTLGDLTLRAETAARVALPVLRYIWDAL